MRHRNCPRARSTAPDYADTALELTDAITKFPNVQHIYASCTLCNLNMAARIAANMALQQKQCDNTSMSHVTVLLHHEMQWFVSCANTAWPV
jgi:hypothetical protein